MRSSLTGLCLLLAAALVLPGAHAGQTAQGKIRKAAATRPAAAPDAAVRLNLRSSAAMVFDESTGAPIYGKNTELVTPIASITKLMTAMVVLDAGLPLDEEIVITPDDIDVMKGTRSRLHVGATLTRRDLLLLALMASENRAASALGRAYPGGRAAFIARMNAKGQEIGMDNTRFMDSTGLSSANVSTAGDLVRLVAAADEYPLIREFSTTASHSVDVGRRRPLEFRNSNALVRSKAWDIDVSKTGYISEAGRCLVMKATIASRRVIIVLLDSVGKNSRLGDANRIRKWMEGAGFRSPMG
jgi:D-alanyl-D-alanine endopeptidase (penicillin-binding protein 7)